MREKSLGIEKSGMMGGGSGGDNGGEQPAASVVEGNPAIDRGQLAGIIASGGQHVNRSVGADNRGGLGENMQGCTEQ